MSAGLRDVRPLLFTAGSPLGNAPFRPFAQLLGLRKVPRYAQFCHRAEHFDVRSPAIAVTVAKGVDARVHALMSERESHVLRARLRRSEIGNRHHTQTRVVVPMSDLEPLSSLHENAVGVPAKPRHGGVIVFLQQGESANRFIAWSNTRISSYQPSPIIVGDYYYTLLDRGFLTCHDARTGKEIYGRQRISADSSGFSASPWSYNGRIFALSEDGDTFVIQAGPEFKLLGRNSLGEMSMATPAVANGSLILRTANTLYRITQQK